MSQRILALLLFLSLAAWARAITWPEGYLVFDAEENPGATYGILIPTYDDSNLDETVTYLANLKTHKVLTVLKGVHYWEHANHYSLSATWSDDGHWGVIEYDWRFGFSVVALVEIDAQDRVTQTDLGKHITKATPNASDCSVYFRLGDDKKIRFRVVSTSDPKSLNPENAKYGLFQGVYDVKQKKWTVEDGRTLNGEQYDLLSLIYDDSNFANRDNDDPQARTELFDKMLNEAYQAVKIVVPPAKFAKIKEQQVAWLKSFEATAKTADRKNEALKKRALELRENLW